MSPPRFRTGAACAAGVVMLLSLAACSSQSMAAAGTWGESGEGKPQLVLEENGQLTGTDGCNRLMGAWEQDGDRIVFGEIATSMMACPDVDTWLMGLDSAEIDGDELVVSDAAGSEIGSLSRVSE